MEEVHGKVHPIYIRSVLWQERHKSVLRIILVAKGRNFPVPEYCMILSSARAL